MTSTSQKAKGRLPCPSSESEHLHFPLQSVPPPNSGLWVLGAVTCTPPSRWPCASWLVTQSPAWAARSPVRRLGSSCITPKMKDWKSLITTGLFPIWLMGTKCLLTQACRKLYSLGLCFQSSVNQPCAGALKESGFLSFSLWPSLSRELSTPTFVLTSTHQSTANPICRPPPPGSLPGGSNLSTQFPGRDNSLRGSRWSHLCAHIPLPPPAPRMWAREGLGLSLVYLVPSLRRGFE